MDSDLTRSELETLASSGNQWAQQELIKKFGFAHDGIYKFDSDQARDANGRWVSTGGGGEEGGSSPKSGPAEKVAAAWEATRVAYKSKSPADHAAAALAHSAAALATRDHGDNDAADLHYEMTEYHGEEAKRNINDPTSQVHQDAVNAMSDVSHLRSYEVELTKVDASEEDESLNDVLRHDKEHDEWHASHGDPPCKSAADCKRMQAKYAEKALQVAVRKGSRNEVSSPRNDVDLPNPMIEKLKRDIAAGGHVAEVARELLAKYNPDEARDDHGRFASEASRKANEKYPHGTTEDNDEGAKAHQEAAFSHELEAKTIARDGTDPSTASYHAQMAQQHADKAQEFADAAAENEDRLTEDMAQHYADIAQRSAQNARDAVRGMTIKKFITNNA
jgi:hypothetical protein